MDFNRRLEQPTLICTCSDLQDSIDLGCEDSEEIMYDLGTQFRCGVCRPVIDRMLKRRDSSKHG